MDAKAESNASIMRDESEKEPVKKRNRRTSFTEALREKYCHSLNIDDNEEFSVNIFIQGMPRNNGSDEELGHLRNVVLNNNSVSHAGLPRGGLVTLCPNIVDLDLSTNFLESWEELLPILIQLPKLKVINLSRNYIGSNMKYLKTWSGQLPKVETLILNSTGVSWREVLELTLHMPALCELHACCNGYESLEGFEPGMLNAVECLRLNKNRLTSWQEVCRLCHMPHLVSLMLSENPLQEVFYSNPCYFTRSLPTSAHLSSDDCCGPCGIKGDVSPCPAGCGCSSGQEPCMEDHSTSCCRQILEEVLQSSWHCKDMTKQNSQRQLLQAENVRGRMERLARDCCGAVDICFHDNQVTSQVFFRSESALKSKVQEEGERPMSESHDCGQQDTIEISGSGCSRKSAGHTEEAVGHGTDHSSCDEAVPFSVLRTLCLSQTNISCWSHLQALARFPCLKELRIMNIKLADQVPAEERRKLFVASLPNIQVLNGSEVTVTEREKAERHYLRFFLDCSSARPSHYSCLESKHGPVRPLVDIDLGARYQEWADLAFFLCGQFRLKEKIHVVEPVGKLRSFVATAMRLSTGSFRMFHRPCGPGHDDLEGVNMEELRLDSLPMSRYDFLNGDEIHVDVIKQ